MPNLFGGAIRPIARALLFKKQMLPTITSMFVYFRVDREAMEETIVNGITVPKGMIVQIPIAALHNDPDVWDDPEKFDPERYTNK